MVIPSVGSFWGPSPSASRPIDARIAVATAPTKLAALRKGIEWSDGKPLTAKDVAFTFNLIRDNQDKLTHTAEISFLKEAIAEDNVVVRFVLKQPNPRWW